MLLGEHAVVYGRPCIVTAVDQRMYATVERTDAPFLTLHAPDVGLESYEKPISLLMHDEVPKGARFVEQALAFFLDLHPCSGGISVTTASEFSALFGFGSSSASTVAFLRAIAELVGVPSDAREIFDLAYRTILAVQKTGSGFDVAAAAWGGTLHYARGGEIAEVLPDHPFTLVVGYTGVKVETAPIVHRIREEARHDGGRIERLYDSMATLVERAVAAFRAVDWSEFGACMNEDQELLSSLGVSSEILDRLIGAARGAGALGAKLSGTGIGDCMIALATPATQQSVSDAIAAAGGTVLPVRVHALGARVESATS